MRELLRKAVELGGLRAVDLQLARRLEILAGDNAPELLLAAALVSHRVGEGDVCLDLGSCAELPLFRTEGLVGGPRLPCPRDWADALRRCTVVGRPGERAPLILDGRDRLYLGRYWHFERALADALRARSGTWAPGVDRNRLREGIGRLFPASGEIDWQRVAAAMAVLRPLCVISGGPGTGKTRAVASILTLLEEQAGDAALRIALAAPTGKAAARLSESIRGARARLSLRSETAVRIPEEALTLHRLLGFRPGRANPRHGPGDPLHLDVLVVDEASMVDLPLMSRLLAALPVNARLILLGDKDQLSSVEAGMVLGDICGRGRGRAYSPELCAAVEQVTDDKLEPAAEPGPAIADHIVELRTSWRFGQDSGIGALARAVNRGQTEASLDILSGEEFPEVILQPPSPGVIADLISQRIVPVYREVLVAPDSETALAALSWVRVLCALRSGPQGVRRLNERIEHALKTEGLIRCDGEIYAGRPVMLTANDQALRLYNGDVGLVLADSHSGGALRVFFATAEGIRRILPSRLPPHETVYAMTVHKSQGSEFDEVVLVLPEAESRVLTRELLYTGITRSRKRVRLLADEERLRTAIARPVLRSTGLYDALWRDAERD
jgi:exodeoxyribonuclease V alpha subunit